jgi:serine/threonine protein phosphatase PrpC
MQGIVDKVEGSSAADVPIVKLKDSVKEKSTQSKNLDTPLIIAEPEIKVTSICEKDDFLLLACDGLFDVFNYDEIVEFVLSQMSIHQNPKLCCENLTYEAIKVRKSKDNVSVLLIILNKWY